MTLKLVLLSVDGTFSDAERRSSKKIRSDLARLARQLHDRGVRTAIWSNRSWTIGNKSLHEHLSDLAGVPISAHGVKVDGMPSRRQAGAVLPVLATYGVKKHETILVGSTDEDMRAGVNNGLLHIRSDWHGKQSGYGFSVQTVEEFARFCFVFALRQHPLFWRIEEGPLKIYTAGPFSTMNEAYALFGTDARAAAKFGAGHPDFWFYLTISTLYFAGILEGVNYICLYPGHDTVHERPSEDSMGGVLTRLAKCFRMGFYDDVIVRHVPVPKSQFTPAAKRRFTTQINSIHLNRYPHKNLSPNANRGPLQLNDKTVLVVDDFCTSGRSLEAARAYLNSAGADVRLFSWLKTINTSYCQIRPPVVLRPFEPNELTDEPHHLNHSYNSGIYDTDAPAELAQVFGLYNGWNWGAMP